MYRVGLSSEWNSRLEVILILPREDNSDVGKKENEVYQKMVEDMKTFPFKTKRSVEEFSLFSKQLPQTDIETFPQKYEKILKIYECKYGGLRK